jgi:hypothetical protein
MAVLADAAPGGPVPGRTCKRQWTGSAAGCPAEPLRSVRVPLPQCPGAAAAGAGVHSAGRLRLRVSAGRVRSPRVRTVDVCRLRRPGRNPGRPRNRTPRHCPPWVRDCGQVLAGRPPFAADTAAAPRSRLGTWRSPAADRPCPPASDGTGRQPAPTVSTPAAQARRGRLSRPGCPPDGVLPQPAETAAVSAVRSELRPLAMVSGRLVSTVDSAACRCPLLQEAVAGQVAAGQVPPLPVGAGT